jgi:hypothetical protein
MIDENKPRLTFQISNSEEFFNKLLQEYADFDKQHLNPRHAINCSITSWHLTDWTYHEYSSSNPKFQDSEKTDNKGCIKKISGLLKYQQYLIKECPELDIMRLIANGSKHCILKDKSITKETKIGKGDYSTDYSRHDYQVPRFEIKISDSETIDFEKAFLITLEFWKRLISKR